MIGFVDSADSGPVESEGDAVERPGRDGRPYRPEYGLVEAALGYWVFYLIVDAVTPTVVDVVQEAMPGRSASAVTVALAAALWVVLFGTVLWQARTQSRALGREADVSDRERAVPSETEATVATIGLLLGGMLAVGTYDVAMATLPAVVRATASADASVVFTPGFVGLVGFFLGYGVATWAADRLVIGGVRSLMAE
jgi:hypothetical protein